MDLVKLAAGIEAELEGGYIVFKIPLPIYRKAIEEAKPPFPHLTLRERQVAEGIDRGKANKELAEELHLSIRTVKFHVCSAMKKYGVRSRVDLAMVRLGLAAKLVTGNGAK